MEYAAKGIALEVRTIIARHEVEVHLLLLEHNLLDAKLLASHAKGNHQYQLFANGRNRTKTVYKALAIGIELEIELGAIGQIVELAIEQHALGIAGHILIGEVHLDVGIEGAIVDPRAGRMIEVSKQP